MRFEYDVVGTGGWGLKFKVSYNRLAIFFLNQFNSAIKDAFVIPTKEGSVLCLKFKV